MTKTLTLKNVPDRVIQRLTDSAAANRRSLNSEAIACLDAALQPSRTTAAERLARARAVRGSLRQGQFRTNDIDVLKCEGRM